MTQSFSSPGMGRIAALLEGLGLILGFYLVRTIWRFLELPKSGSSGVIIMLIVATVLLYRRKQNWKSVGMARPAHLGMMLIWVVSLYLALAVTVNFITLPLASWLGFAPLNLAAFEGLYGNLPYLLFMLVFVAWGAAGFGEEMLFRGFVLQRLAMGLGDSRGAWLAAVVIQSAAFGLGHLYLGGTGVLQATTVGLVFGLAYLLNGRNLWALILTHGLLDTFSLYAIYAGFLGNS